MVEISEFRLCEWRFIVPHQIAYLKYNCLNLKLESFREMFGKGRMIIFDSLDRVVLKHCRKAQSAGLMRCAIPSPLAWHAIQNVEQH